MNFNFWALGTHGKERDLVFVFIVCWLFSFLHEYDKNVFLFIALHVHISDEWKSCYVHGFLVEAKLEGSFLST